MGEHTRRQGPDPVSTLSRPADIKRGTDDVALTPRGTDPGSGEITLEPQPRDPIMPPLEARLTDLEVRVLQLETRLSSRRQGRKQETLADKPIDPAQGADPEEPGGDMETVDSVNLIDPTTGVTRRVTVTPVNLRTARLPPERHLRRRR